MVIFNLNVFLGTSQVNQNIEVIDVEVSNTQIMDKLISIENTLKFVLMRLNALEISNKQVPENNIMELSLPIKLPVSSITLLLEAENEIIKTEENKKQMVGNIEFTMKVCGSMLSLVNISDA